MHIGPLTSRPTLSRPVGLLRRPVGKFCFLFGLDNMGFESNPVYFTLQFATVLSAADYSKTVAVLVQKYKY